MRLSGFSMIAPQRKVNKSQKKGLTWAPGEAAAVCNRSYLSLWDRVREKEKKRRGGEQKREEGRGEGPRAWRKRGRGIRGKARKWLWTMREEHRQRGESSDSGALTQRCLTLKGMCWQWEVVFLSQMTSASLLKSIG